MNRLDGGRDLFQKFCTEPNPLPFVPVVRLRDIGFRIRADDESQLNSF